MISSLAHNKKQVQSAKRFIMLVLAILLLVAGGTLYLAFRTLSLRMFGWCDAFGLMDSVNQMRAICSDIHPAPFVLYNFPDLLWIISYLLFVNAIIPASDRKTYIFWILLMPALAICHEIMQGLGLANGAFDAVDVLCYLTPTIINIIITNLTHFTHEKVL